MSSNNRQIRNTWRFEHGTVTSTEGIVSTASGGRALRSSVDSNSIDINTGSQVLMLGSRLGETPIVLGVSPWIVG